MNFDVDFNIPGDSSQNIFQAVVGRKLLKGIKQRIQKAEYNAQRITGGMKRVLSAENLRNRTKRIFNEKRIKAPPFLRLTDKIAFTMSLLISFLTEAILLTKPELLGNFYTLLAIPLLIARYYQYSQIKFQYFLLDFCYFVNIATILFVHFVQNVHFFSDFFKAVPGEVNRTGFMFEAIFLMANGPLAIGIVMWRNSLVFHDLDKLTSVFIHIYPALVTYSLRWFSQDTTLICSHPDCYMDFRSVMYALLFYIAWQLIYLVQTEIIDRDRIRSCDLMTSAKWMGNKKPHSIYMMIANALGFAPSPMVTLVSTQLLYTFVTFLPIFVMFGPLGGFYLHTLYLFVIITVCIWNGSNFYFEIFTETYSKRLHRFVKEMEENQARN